MAATSPSSRALVTGATAGIGREFVEQLAARGHALVLNARNSDRLEQVASEVRSRYGVECELLAADLTDRDQLARVEARLEADTDPVALLVNNAGFGLKHPFLDNTVEEEQSLLDVHVVAPMRLTHVGLGAMLRRGGGQIVNVSSVAGFLPRGSYSAAKGYATALSLWAGNEYGPRGVQVMALCPGFVRTEFHGRMEVTQASAPRFLWLEVGPLVREALADLDAGKTLSIPSRRYRAIVAATRLVPRSVLQRFERMGRK